LAINGAEIANSARVVAHLGAETPTIDFGFFPGVDDGSYSLDEVEDLAGMYIPDDPPVGVFVPDFGFEVGSLHEHPESPGFYLIEWQPCMPIESIEHPGLALMDDSQTEVSEGLATPMTGSRIFGPGILIHDRCWGSPTICSSCQSMVNYDDSWPGQREWLKDIEYRPELAPWYTSEIPESGEFGGIWVLTLDGLDSTSSERSVTQTVGAGAVAGPARDASREINVSALLLGCTNAGVEHGLKWLTNELRRTKDTVDLALRYLTASPAHSLADPNTLLRECHGLVLTGAPKVTQRYNTGSKKNQHGNVYVVEWSMATLDPYAYMPAVDVAVEWDKITRQPINWIHAADCQKPESCLTMPIMFGDGCEPEFLEQISTPPPVCGGCLPVSAIDKYSFRVPTMEYAFRGRETAVSLVVKNTSTTPLTCQVFWRECGSDVRCEDNQYPLQINGLPVGAELHLDGITGLYRAWYDERWRLPMGIVGTPNGAPWRPPLIDRQVCWDFIIQAAATATFDVSMSLADREP
jgi:hypothetical protein